MNYTMGNDGSRNKFYVMEKYNIILIGVDKCIRDGHTRNSAPIHKWTSQQQDTVYEICCTKDEHITKRQINSFTAYSKVQSPYDNDE